MVTAACVRERAAVPHDVRRAADPPGRALAALVKNTVGVTITVEVVEPDGVERSMGKMRRIVDQRPKS
ncbi:MAG: phenylacetate-CoA ligase [Actinoplanes sp.]|jgi:phenylacetate-CoA ligase|nr:phenylacetate-CoA ligase [Actinoplanes sp.]